MQILAIKRQMDSGYALTPQYIKNEDVSAKEMAVVSEHLDELPGVDVTSDWEREYPYKTFFAQCSEVFPALMKDCRPTCSTITCRLATAEMTGSEKAIWNTNMKAFCRAKKPKSKISQIQTAMSREQKRYLKAKPVKISCLRLTLICKKKWKNH